MVHPVPRLSRRGLIAAAAAGSALALGTSTAAAAGDTVDSGAELVTRDQIADAVTIRPEFGAASLRYEPDFHHQLESWLRFWWANAPGSWGSPLRLVTTGTSADGRRFRLSGIEYQQLGVYREGFNTSWRTSRPELYWGTIASLYLFFPQVDTGDQLVIGAGQPGYVTPPGQRERLAAHCRPVWGRLSPAEVLRRTGCEPGLNTHLGWRAFLRATTRRGLGTETYTSPRSA